MEMLVPLYHVADGVHIWHADFTVLFDEAVNVEWIPPVLDLLVQTQVDEYSGRSSTHAGRAVHIHVEALDVDQIVEHLGSLKQLRRQIVLVEVYYRKVNGCDSLIRVRLHHELLVDAAEAQVAVGLHVEDAGDTCVPQRLDVFLGLRIGPQEYVCVAYFVKEQLAHKVRISLLHMTIYNVHLVAITELAAALLTQLAFVAEWVKDLKFSCRLTLPHRVVLHLVEY